MAQIRPAPRFSFFLSFEGARRIFIAIGVIFVASGIVVTGLRLAGAIPPGFSWHGPAFLALGSLGVVIARFGVRSRRRWPLALLIAVYGPWTVWGLLGDIRQRLWPLVAGETLGLALLLWAVASVVAARPRRGE